MYVDGQMQARTAAGRTLTLNTRTTYPVGGNICISVDVEEAESFELLLRIPGWSKQNSLKLNGKEISISSTEELSGYVSVDREWIPGDTIELVLDMRTESIRPIPYGNQVLMNHVVWGGNYMIPTYDEEDPLAKYHLALRRGPIVLAQENRLGYSVDEPVDILVGEDGYVDVTFPEKEIAPYENILEVEVPLTDGSKMHVTDYASAGKLWTEESKMAAWMLVK